MTANLRDTSPLSVVPSWKFDFDGRTVELHRVLKITKCSFISVSALCCKRGIAFILRYTVGIMFVSAFLAYHN